MTLALKELNGKGIHETCFSKLYKKYKYILSKFEESSANTKADH